MASAQPFGRSRGYVYASAPRPPEDDWIAVVADAFVALIESGHGDRGVDALTRLAQAGPVSLEEIVSAIPAGTGGVDSFAVARYDEETADGWQITAVVRGRAVVDVYSVGGARRFTSSGMQPWLIATFRDVVAVELGGPARRFGAISHRAPSALAIGQGSAHAGGVLWSAVAAESAGFETADGEAGYVRPPASFDDDTVRHVRALIGAAQSGSAASPSIGPGPDVDVDVEKIERAARPGFDDVTVERTAADERAVDEHVVSEHAVDEAGRTPTHGDAPSLPKDAATGLAGLVDDEEGAEASGVVLVAVAGHDAVPLENPIVVGRKPVDRRRSGSASVLVTVPSPQHVVSASHVRIERAGRAVVVTDLRSRNGTTIALAGGGSRRLRPGESFAVPGAATIDIGDGTIIDITPAAP